MATGHVRDGCIFPVGFIVQLTTDTDPAEHFGGKWQRIKGRFLLAADDAHPAGATGGQETLGMYPSEKESSGWGLSQAPGFRNRVMVAAAFREDFKPPYYTVYIWERIG